MGCGTEQGIRKVRNDLKILQIIQKPQLRGAEIFACQLSVELIKLGHKVDVVYLFKNTSFDLDFNLNFISLKANRRRRFWDVRAYKKLNDVICQEKYDIVQANASDTLKYAVISKKIYKWESPLIYRNASKISAYIRSWLHRWFHNLFLAQCDYFISVSENCRQDLIGIYPDAAGRSETINIGTYAFANIKPIFKKDDQPVFINVGSLVPEKNHSFLLDIFYSYYQKHKKGRLYLVGDGYLRMILENKAEQMGIREQVTFFGYRNNVISIIKASDIMVIPSKIEGLPGVSLEALSCGIPVIAANVGGIAEVVKDDINGYCLGEYTVEEYLNKIEIILGNKILYSKMSQNGRKLINQKFLMPDITKRFLDLYSRIKR